MGDVLQGIDDWAARQPDTLLYAFLDVNGREVERLTYRAFVERVEVIASHLAADDRFSPGDRLILAYPPGLEMICAFFGCVRAGLIPTPVPAPAAQGLSASLFRLRHVMHDCNAAGVLTTVAVAKQVRNAGWEADRLFRVTWIATESLSAGPIPAPRHQLGDILFLQYTSGSTSDPKGVMVSHDNILANSRLVLDHEAPVAVSWLPQHHDMGLIGYYINTALGGGTLYGFAPSSFIQRPALWLETITRVRGTASSAPNFAFEHCLQSGRIPEAVRKSLDLSSLRFLMAAAEPIKPTIYREFLQAFAPYGLRTQSFVVAYGLAENTLAVSSYGRRILAVGKTALARHRVRPTVAIYDVADARHLMSCGRPLGDNVVRIINPATRRPAAPDAVGEIWVNGKSKCLGYWGKPAATRAVFAGEIAGEPQAGRFLRTGDMGFLREGELYVCGRRKDMLIVRGQNYYPQDIEAVVEQADGVRKTSVAAIEVERGDGYEIVVLAEVSRRGPEPDPRKTAQAIRSHLGLEVDRVIFVASRSLPKTSSGKLMRFRARELWLEGALSVTSEYARDTEPEMPAALRLDGPFKHISAKYRLSGDEPYTLVEAGLDSLELVQCLHEFSEILHARGAMDLADAVDFRLLEQLSVAQLFRLAARLEASPDTAIAQLRHSLALLGEQRRTDLQMMGADRRLTLQPMPKAREVEFGAAGQILLTGATGFLGPFLLTSLLTQTSAQLSCVVRGQDAVHAHKRLCTALQESSPRTPQFWRELEKRVKVVAGDLEQPRLGLDDRVWHRLCSEIDTVYHNGAFVNYLFGYNRMRAANVLGTKEAVRLAFEGRTKTFNYLSTTFIFGWATKHVLYEADSNEGMELLDFGYSQSKWVAEQVVMEAKRQGLITRIFRPALITPATNGDGANYDITLRLLAFMVKHGVGVNALNQVSFMPADVTANNVVAISNLPHTAHGVFHVTRDNYANMMDITDIITRLTGQHFELFDLPAFVPEVIRRCTPGDLLFPLLDFLVGSLDEISAMNFKRYDSSNYQRARAATPWGQPDPPLADVVTGMLSFMRRTRLINLPESERTYRSALFS
jgi:thioester reductase-like protein